ncbi:hemoglobin [Ancylomarina subtilis]|uniref:Hemoglobin n=1 Tax=Ancylomarina subtilis TaxID=1639035 RepID=A0A4Q7VHY4_9BACT|nr:group 1 truncated hemoglobin [Ancylomarina subtilis]RZT95721.1 hemoglobin [Ancylomarina subtilis]
MSEILYERLGGTEGITKIASDAVDFHFSNPRIATRFKNAKASVEEMKHGAATFFIVGTGGPSVYKGKDMMGTHRGMNISNTEFVEVLSDVLKALNKNNIAQREKEEVLYVLFSMKDEIVSV